MMLTKLVEYAEREGLGDPDFETRQVHYLLDLGQDGRFLGLIPLGDGKGQRRSGLPRVPSNNNPGSNRFLVATAEYVFGTERKVSTPGTERSAAAYRELVGSAANESGDDGLRALDRFLGDPRCLAEADAALARLEGQKENERFQKVIVPALGGKPVHTREAVRQWWVASRARGDDGSRLRCLVTGGGGPVARTHPKIKGLRDQGALVSFQEPAYTSQFLEKGENAPISEAAAAKYTEAINSLLEADPATKRRKSAIDLDQAVVIFWTREPSDATSYVLDVLNPPADSGEAVAASMAVWQGRRSTNFSPTPFYACTLAANTGRVVVRDWLETTAAAVKQALDRWLEDLYVGVGEPEPVPLPRLLKALEVTPESRNDKRGLPPGLATTLFHAAVLGARLPVSLLAAAVARMRVPPRKRERGDVLRLRVAVIKAVLRRTYERKEIDVALDENYTEPAYLLGRLFAVLERLQGEAKGEVNATIRDRYYGAASTTPAAVFPRLLGLSVHHESKLRKDKKGLANWYDQRKAEIVSKLAAAPLPATLDLQRQGLFAVGY